SFDSNLNVVIKKYEEFIDTLALESTKDKANYYFGRKPLISKVCPRYVSSSLNKAWDYLSLKEYSEAENMFEKILSKSENYSAVIGLTKIYEDSDSLSKAIIFLRSFEKTFEGTSSEYDLKFRLAELYVKNSEFAKAKEIYDLLLNAKPIRRLELLANTRIALFNDGTTENYVSGSDYDKYSILKELNSKAYNYSSIPLMIDLSNSLEEDYRTFLQYFENDLEVKDEMSSYAVYKISEYMLNNLDYVNARKMAGLATEWFFRNAENILTETRFELN
nr:hypothetical protein [Ignavibacteriaceae bacterium]